MTAKQSLMEAAQGFIFDQITANSESEMYFSSLKFVFCDDRINWIYSC